MDAHGAGHSPGELSRNSTAELTTAARTAITTYILKIASRCNLACTYCYMYTGPDQSWRSLPRFMEIERVRDVLTDIADYSQSVGLRSVSLVLHGGEPMLYPPAMMEDLLVLVDELLIQKGIDAHISIQTNATVLRSTTLQTLIARKAAFGISLDLSDESHDRNRVDKRGKGTSAAVHAGVQTIRQASGSTQPQGALLVIDPEVTPAQAYDRLSSLGIPYVDILLPDENWETADPEALADTFGPWLLEFFELYVSQPRVFQVRWLQSALKLASGGVWGSDSLGLRGAGTLIVDTDGSYHFHDVLRTAGESINATGIHAGASSIAEIESQPVMRMMMDKAPYLADECTECPVVHICGGGHIAHRFSDHNGLRNASVYCGAIRPLYLALSRLASDTQSGPNER